MTSFQDSHDVDIPQTDVASLDKTPPFTESSLSHAHDEAPSVESEEVENPPLKVLSQGGMNWKRILVLVAVIVLALTVIAGVTIGLLVEFKHINFQSHKKATLHPADRIPSVTSVDSATLLRSYQRDILWIDNNLTHGDLVHRVLYHSTLPPNSVSYDEYISRHQDDIVLEVESCASLDQIKIKAWFSADTYGIDDFFIPIPTSSTLGTQGDNEQDFPAAHKYLTQHFVQKFQEQQMNSASSTSTILPTSQIHFPLFQPNNTIVYNSISSCYSSDENEYSIQIAGAYKIKSARFTTLDGLGQIKDEANFISSSFIIDTASSSYLPTRYFTFDVVLELEFIPSNLAMYDNVQFDMDVLGRWDPHGTYIAKPPHQSDYDVSDDVKVSSFEMLQTKDPSIRNEKKSENFDQVASRSGLIYERNEDGDIVNGSGDYRQFNHLDYPVSSYFNTIPVIYDSIDSNNVLLGIDSDQQHGVYANNMPINDNDMMFNVQSILSLDNNDDTFINISDTDGFSPFTIPYGMSLLHFFQQRVPNSRIVANNVDINNGNNNSVSVLQVVTPPAACVASDLSSKHYHIASDSFTKGFARTEQNNGPLYTIVCRDGPETIYLALLQLVVNGSNPVISKSDSRKCSWNSNTQRYETMIYITEWLPASVSPYYVHLFQGSFSYTIETKTAFDFTYDDAANSNCGIGIFYVTSPSFSLNLDKDYSDQTISWSRTGDLFGSSPQQDTSSTSNDMKVSPSASTSNSWKTNLPSSILPLTNLTSCEKNWDGTFKTLVCSLQDKIEKTRPINPPNLTTNYASYQLKAQITCQTCKFKSNLTLDGLRIWYNAGLGVLASQIEARIFGNVSYELDLRAEFSAAIKAEFEEDFGQFHFFLDLLSIGGVGLGVQFDTLVKLKSELDLKFNLAASVNQKNSISNMYMVYGVIWDSNKCPGGASICGYSQQFNQVPISKYTPTLQSSTVSVGYTVQTSVEAVATLDLEFSLEITVAHLLVTTFSLPTHFQAIAKYSNGIGFSPFSQQEIDSFVLPFQTQTCLQKFHAGFFVIGTVGPLILDSYVAIKLGSWIDEWTFHILDKKSIWSGMDFKLLLTCLWPVAKVDHQEMKMIATKNFEKMDAADQLSFKQRLAAYFNVDFNRIDVTSGSALPSPYMLDASTNSHLPLLSSIEPLQSSSNTLSIVNVKISGASTSSGSMSSQLLLDNMAATYSTSATNKKAINSVGFNYVAKVNYYFEEKSTTPGRSQGWYCYQYQANDFLDLAVANRLDKTLCAAIHNPNGTKTGSRRRFIKDSAPLSSQFTCNFSSNSNQAMVAFVTKDQVKCNSYSYANGFTAVLDHSTYCIAEIWDMTPNQRTGLEVASNTSTEVSCVSQLFSATSSLGLPGILVQGTLRFDQIPAMLSYDDIYKLGVAGTRYDKWLAVGNGCEISSSVKPYFNVHTGRFALWITNPDVCSQSVIKEAVFNTVRSTFANPQVLLSVDIDAFDGYSFVSFGYSDCQSPPFDFYYECGPQYHEAIYTCARTPDDDDSPVPVDESYCQDLTKPTSSLIECSSLTCSDNFRCDDVDHVCVQTTLAWIESAQNGPCDFSANGDRFIDECGPKYGEMIYSCQKSDLVDSSNPQTIDDAVCETALGTKPKVLSLQCGSLECFNTGSICEYNRCSTSFSEENSAHSNFVINLSLMVITMLVAVLSTISF